MSLLPRHPTDSANFSAELLTEHVLQSAYRPLFIIAAGLQAGQYTENQIPLLRDTCLAQLDTAREALPRLKVPQDWILDAQLAVVALVDASARTSGNTGLAEAWRSLQFELYHEELLGIQFFDRLTSLCTATSPPYPVLSIYALCLAYDFRGQLAGERLNELKKTRDSLFLELSRRGSGPLPHGMASFQDLKQPPPLLPISVIIGSGILILLLLGTLLSALLVGRSRAIQDTLKMDPTSQSSSAIHHDLLPAGRDSNALERRKNALLPSALRSSL